MSDHSTHIIDLVRAVEQFRDEREWGKFHSPGNLASAISIEAAELLENFLWETGEADLDLDTAANELADIVIYCLSFASVTGIDVSNAVRDKIEANARKYPVEIYKGINEWRF